MLERATIHERHHFQLKYGHSGVVLLEGINPRKSASKNITPLSGVIH